MSPEIIVNNGGGGSSDFLALLAIVISVVSALFSIWWNFRSERRGYLDSYWFREVTAPSCINPAIELREKWSKKVSDLANISMNMDEYRSFTSDLDRDIRSAIEKAWVSKLFRGNLYISIRKHHEAVLDQVATSLQSYVGGPVYPASHAVALAEDISANWMGILRDAAQANASSLKI